MLPARSASSTLRERLAVVAGIALLAAGCAGQAPDAAPEPEPEPDASAVPVTPVALPDTPVGEQLAWVVDVLQGEDTDTDDAALQERFDETFLAEVAPMELRQVFDQFQGTWTVTDYQGSPDGLEAVATLEEQGGAVFELVGVAEPDPPHRLTGLWLRPPSESIEPPADFAELTDRLDDAAEQAVLLAAEVTDGTCTPLHAHHSDLAVPVGSIGKLYVLGAVADAVADGALAWDDTVEVVDERRSLPTGVLQDEPAGTAVSVVDAAQGMIEISDNTATDLLIDAVGREAVEAAQARLGHAEPALNVPFVTTRELFQLKWQVGADERADYLAADADERRRVLDEDLAVLPLDIQIGDMTAPVEVDTLEWFASADDLCRAHVALAELGAQDATAPVRDVLSANPGVAVDPEVWPYVGFKGGSEPGVLALSWYLEDADGRAYVLAAAAMDTDTALDELLLVQLMAAGIDLLADGR